MTAQEIRNHISEGSSKLIKFFFEIDYEHEDFQTYKSDFLSDYKKKLNKKYKLFEGMQDLLYYLGEDYGYSITHWQFCSCPSV